MVSGATPAAACAIATASAWPPTLGAVYPIFEEPSLLSAEPFITARTWSPPASASASRFSTTAPTPPPGTVPAASASNARQCPSGEKMPSAWYR
jgi:hypothetical protein